MPLMSTREKSIFAFNVIENFLIQPVAHYSQVSIIYGLNDFKIPFGELFTYLAMKLGVKNQKEGDSKHI
jgi:hypothetical protein